MAYINVPTNTQCVLNGMIQVTEVAATCNLEDNGAADFTIESDGACRISLAGIGAVFDTAGQQLIIRTSLSAGDPTINNDGIYEVEAIAGDDSWIEVVKPDWEWHEYADAAAVTFDEIDTFILHPTKGHMNWMAYVINSAANNPQISFEPGGYWAAKPEVNAPVIQGQPLGATKNLFQIETARFAQTESEELIAGPPIINRKGSVLMRVIPQTGVSGATVSVALIQLIGNK